MTKTARIKTSPYDSADYLKDEAEAMAYLQSCIDEDPEDAQFIAMALGTMMRAQNRFRQVAADADLSRESLYKALSGRRDPAFSTVLKVLRAMGLKLVLTGQTAPVAAAAPPILVEWKPADKPVVYPMTLNGTAKTAKPSQVRH